SDKTLSNVKATYALDYYKQNAKQKPSRTADKQDDIIRNIMDYWGFDGSNELNSDFNFRYVQMVKYLDGGGFMNAGNGITGINKNEQGAILGVDTGWGTMHELGHNFDTRNRNIIEVSNNMVPQWFMYLENKPSRITNNNSWENDIFPKVTKEDYSNNQWYPADSPYNLQRLAPLWQLQIYDTTFWPKFEKKFREIKFNGGNEVEIHNAWLAIASDVLQLDLSEHFERHGMKVHADTKAYISKYTKSDKKLWYVNDKIYADNKYAKFTDSLDYSISSANLNNNQVTLELTMDKENIKNTLGYEVYRDDKLIGFTEKQTFIDKDIQEGKNYEYKVVAFDKSITPSRQAIRKLYTPKINVQDEINVELNSKFDPLKYVVAKTYDNKDITYNVKVIDNNVDTLAKGEYEVEYAIEAEGTTITDKAKVTVVSSIDYLSDGNATSSRVGWGKVEKDLAPDKSTIKLKRKGSEIEYAKGVGAHAESKLVYNIENKGFEFFESYIGIDDCARGTKASATFEIYADDKKIYDSGLMTGNDEQKHVKVLLKGINELKLITTDGGSNSISSDQTVWADAKFISNDSKPILTLDKSVATKVGEPIEDIIGEIMATDKEDGDISSSVEVTGNKDIDFNRTGKHTLIYTVTDSDGNRVTENRTISVVDMEDSKELTDCDYKSAVQSYSKVYIDKSVSSNPLRLTDKDGGVIEFAKGIGAHSTSTVIYDIATLDADYFTAKVGVDRAMYGTVGSVSFEVHLDGTKVFDSGVMSSRDSYKEVEVSLAGSKELKLIVKDGGNGNGSDHATWGDTKLHFVNSTRIYTDFSELDTILESTTHLEGYLYETNSWRLLEEDINKGVIVLENKNATQEEVDKSLNDLKVSLESLAISKGKEKLKVTLDIAKAKQEEDYNSRGWETFILARDRAEEIYNELGHNESELERYNMSLTIYMGQLTMK
ncbi:MAG: NPCBM/NEW2 domain-containing protein, partial [Romboutsia sp.]